MNLEELAKAIVLTLEVHPESAKAVVHTNATHKGEIVRAIAFSKRHKPPRIILSYD